MRASAIEFSHSDGVGELSGDLDGFRLWYRFPAEYHPLIPGDAFLSAALLVAMKAGEPLEIESPCSPQLLSAARGELQDIFSAWYPDLCRIEVHADTTSASIGPNVGSFFSGGVDGSYTLLRHRDDITHLISVQGIDVQVDNDSLWSKALEANRRTAETFAKTLVPVATNIRRFCHPRGVGWSRLNGAGLASIAHALGFGRVYIAATHTYAELFPWGSHPLSDPLWSSACVALIHDGPAQRSGKLQYIAREPKLLDALRVCWMDAGYNCGTCEKCVRTRTTLHLLGLETPTLKRLDGASEIAKFTVWGESEESFFEDNLNLAEKVGDKPLANALRAKLRSYRARRALTGLDRNLFGGLIHKLKSKLS